VETDDVSLFRWRQRELYAGRGNEEKGIEPLRVLSESMVVDEVHMEHENVSLTNTVLKDDSEDHMDSLDHLESEDLPYRFYHGIWPINDPRGKYSHPTYASGEIYEQHLADLRQAEEAMDARMRQRVERVGTSTLPIPFTTERGTSYWLSNFIVDTIRFRFHNPYYVNRKYRMCHRWSWNYNRVRDLIEEGGDKSIWRAKDFTIPSSSAYYRQHRDEDDT
jgi:hypothetical protein